MHLIKKYANRKLYDTTEKRYVTMDGLAALIKAGQEVRIIDNETEVDLTAQIVSQLLAREKSADANALPSSVLMQMLRKGRGTLFGYGKKYVSLWQSALLMSREELDRLINGLVREKELSESEGKTLKNEMVGYSTGLRKWMKDNIDQRVNEGLSMMNLASQDQVAALTEKVDSLYEKVREIEIRLQSDPSCDSKRRSDES